MNIRDAILAAADHIARNPGEFDFNRISIPDAPGCGTPGCAIGWISVFAGFHSDRLITICENELGRPLIEASYGNATGIDSDKFYARMNDLVSDWMLDASKCATALRLYADKYHPATTRLPDWTAMAATRTVADSAIDEMVRA